MSPAEQTRTARFTLVEAVGVESPRETPFLVALVEAAAGLCPRQTKVLIGALVRAGALSRPASGLIGRGERHASFAAERAAYLGTHVVRKRETQETPA